MTVFGVVFLVLALIKKIPGARTVAIVILWLIISNLAIFLAISALRMPVLLAQSIPQHLMFGTLIVLVVLGIRRQKQRVG